MKCSLCKQLLGRVKTLPYEAASFQSPVILSLHPQPRNDKGICVLTIIRDCCKLIIDSSAENGDKRIVPLSLEDWYVGITNTGWLIQFLVCILLDGVKRVETIATCLDCFRSIDICCRMYITTGTPKFGNLRIICRSWYVLCRLKGCRL